MAELVAAQEAVLGSPLLWASFLAPLLAGLLAPLLGERPRAQAGLALLSWLVSAAALAPAVALVERGRVVVDPLHPRVPGLGVFSMVLDGASLPVAVSVVLVSAMIALYSVPYMRHRFGELGGGSWRLYYLLYQLFTAGMLGAALAGNGILFYLFLELTLVPSALLIILYGYGDRLRVGLIYLVWTHLGALLYLLGLFLAGSYDFYLPGRGYVLAVSSSLVALWLVVLGLAVKTALAGVHFWLPYAHAEAPTPVSALLSPLLIGLGGYAMIRAGLGFFPEAWASVRGLLFAWAVATMLYGGFLVLAQRDVKRLLAYSSVSQMGYMMLGLSLANREALTGAVLHYASHALGKAILFGVAGILIAVLGTRDLSGLGGLASRMRVTASLALLGFLLIAGLPPTLGLWSEVLLAFGFAGWARGLGPGGLVAAAAAVAAGFTLTVIYSFQAYRLIFLGEPRGEGAKRAVEAGRGLTAPLAVLAAAGVVFFVALWLLADPAARTLGSVYALPG